MGAIGLMELHERAVHGYGRKKEEKEGERKEKKEEEKLDKQRQEKRAIAKIPKFEEAETREEFKRKTDEFQTYATRTKLKEEEIAEDLYSAMSTPLKRRMLASSKIKPKWKETNPTVILEEMERVCLPPINLVVERQQFKRLKQEEEEDINNFEARIRAKSAMCGFNRCKCKKNCYITACGSNHEEDEIFDLIVGNMRDKDLQREIWRKGAEFDTLEKVLNGIRASEGAILHQSVEETSQTVWQQSGKSKVKCHNCDKIGHIAKNCKEEAKSQASKSGGKCRFCGGPKLCKAKECKAIDSKCDGCNKFGHLKKCCNANTRAKARESKDPKISQIDENDTRSD